MTLNDLLRGKGYALKEVVVMRHRPREKNLNRVLPWLAAERPELFNAYQQTQGEQLERVLQKVKYVASFIGRSPGKALFVGLFEVNGWKSVTTKECFLNPLNAELIQRGMAPDLSRPSRLWFDLSVDETFIPNGKEDLLSTGRLRNDPGGDVHTMLTKCRFSLSARKAH